MPTHASTLTASSSTLSHTQDSHPDARRLWNYNPAQATDLTTLLTWIECQQSVPLAHPTRTLAGAASTAIHPDRAPSSWARGSLEARPVACTVTAARTRAHRALPPACSRSHTWRARPRIPERAYAAAARARWNPRSRPSEPGPRRRPPRSCGRPGGSLAVKSSMVGIQRVLSVESPGGCSGQPTRGLPQTAPPEQRRGVGQAQGTRGTEGGRNLPASKGSCRTDKARDTRRPRYLKTPRFLKGLCGKACYWNLEVGGPSRIAENPEAGPCL